MSWSPTKTCPRSRDTSCQELDGTIDPQDLHASGNAGTFGAKLDLQAAREAINRYRNWLEYLNSKNQLNPDPYASNIVFYDDRNGGNWKRQ
jgi:hypothetical protein